MRTQKKKSDWSNENQLTARSTKEVIEDHIQLQIAGQLEEDLHRNYDAEAVLLTEFGHFRGHAAWRTHLDGLYRVAEGGYYEILSLQARGDYALLVWKAGASGYVMDCAADSFVVKDGKIHMQTTRTPLTQSEAAVANAD